MAWDRLTEFEIVLAEHRRRFHYRLNNVYEKLDRIQKGGFWCFFGNHIASPVISCLVSREFTQGSTFLSLFTVFVMVPASHVLG